MNCRNCGAELASPQAMVCVKCGVPPLAAKKFCQNCGAPTSDLQAMCTNCGVALMTKGGGGTGVAGSKSKVAAGLLAIFLGSFGIHKFYLGYAVPGIIMLLVWLFGLILVGIPSIIVGIIALIEGIIYLTKTDEDFDVTYVQGKKQWF